MAGSLNLSDNSGSSGAYSPQGGSLSAGAIMVNPNGFFNQTGGSLNAAITWPAGPWRKAPPTAWGVKP